MFPFLSSHGVLGMNARNLLYIKPFNPKKAVAFADDKLKTKAFLAARGIPVAKIYAKIETRKQLRSFDFSALPDECVLKPNYGFGGEGILILKGRHKGEFLEQGKRPVSQRELTEHIEDILDGKFSVNGMMDTAFFERILVADPAFAPFRPVGLPDIRIVVFNLVPVMAMLRIPTAESRGKANVHLGGIGIGIDLAKGTTTHAAQYNRIITELPHGGSPAGFAIPRWEELLLHASRIQYTTNIGYLAADLTLDEEMGPALLEVNARAGLMVQIANLAPLRARLERVKGIDVSSPEKGVRIAQELFGERITDRRVEPEDTRPVLGTQETIMISGDGVTLEVSSLIAPERERTTFSETLVQDLLLKGAAEVEKKAEGTYRVKFTLGGRKLQTVVRAGSVPLAGVKAMIGRRDLSGFLIDPAKSAKPLAMRTSVHDDLRAIDKYLAHADRELLLLKYVKPVNLQEERRIAEEDPTYNPSFSYRPIPDGIAEMEERLHSLTPDDSPFGMLQRKKRRELLQRIALLRSIGDAGKFTEASSILFGLPSSILLTSAQSVLRSRVACELPPPENEMLSSREVAEMFREVLSKYSLHDWKVLVRPSVVAGCTVGGTTVYLREAATFSEENVRSLIAHEIETHALTAENGTHQPFELFRRGFANYLDTQEGLAIFNQNRVLSPHDDKRYGPARLVLAVAFALEHSFAETRGYLESELGYHPEKAISRVIALKRGLAETVEPGGFTKGLSYYRGLRAVEQFVSEGGDLSRLYIGKVALEDLEVLEQVPGLKRPILLPDWMRGKRKK